MRQALLFEPSGAPLMLVAERGDVTYYPEYLAPAEADALTAELLATGERTSAALLGIALDRAGVPARVVNPREIGFEVVGTPLDRAYPSSSAALQERIHREHLLVSPFAQGVTTAPWHFPVRDRVIARLATATVLVEADEKSGTRYVVEECIRQGKVVFARSGLLERLAWLRRASARGEVAQWDGPKEILGRL